MIFKIILVGVLLLPFLPDLSWGACSAGTRFNPNDGYNYGTFLHLWDDNGTGDSSRVPLSAMPPPPSGGYGSYKSFTVSTFTGSVVGCSSGHTPGAGPSAGWVDGSQTQYAVCSSTYGRGVLYTIQGNTSYATDYDCDGTGDSTDNTPTYGADSDNDGIPDADDPWPNDGTKPGNRLYEKSVKFIRNSDGAWIQLYVDSADPFNENTWIVEKSASGLSLSDVNESDWRTETSTSSASQTWYDWNLDNAGAYTGAVNITSKESVTVTSVSGNASGGETGSQVYTDGSTADYDAMFNYLSGIQQNTYDTANNLGAIAGAIDNMSKNQVAGNELLRQIANKDGSGTDMSGVEGRLDTLIDTIPQVGDVETLPSGDATSMQDNSDITGENLETTIQAEYSSFQSWLDEFFGTDNPFSSVITESGVSTSGGVCSLAVSAGSYSFNLDFCPAQGALNTAGVLFLSFCGLFGLVEFLRG